jgi:hypothetical protein
LGSAFAAVTGTGFPATSPAVVTGATPQGTTTINVTTDSRGQIATSVPIPDGYQGSLDMRATVGSAAATATLEAGSGAGEEPAKDAGVRPLAAVTCTRTADVESSPIASPGNVVCLTGESSSRLIIKAGGTANSPITYSGGGNTTVEGIDVTADNVVVEGFISQDAKSMGARLQGDNITFRDNVIDHPVNAADDTDGLRFFGDNITIAHNTISDVSDGADCGNNGCGDGPHPDCMQTYYSESYPTSSNVTIAGNRCEKAAAQCLIAEGPKLPDEGQRAGGEHQLDVLRQLLRHERRAVRAIQERHERDDRRQLLRWQEQQGHCPVRRIDRRAPRRQQAGPEDPEADHVRRPDCVARLHRAGAGPVKGVPRGFQMRA